VTRIVQEKFQVNEPLPDAADHKWAHFITVRDNHGLQTRHMSGRFQAIGKGYNSLPPGMDIEDQEVADTRPMRVVLGGTDDVTDNPRGNDFVKGFVKLAFRPTDDMYSREHQDAFYEDVTVDGSTGFLERNNMLDRS
jgi:hypothetical protein